MNEPNKCKVCWPEVFTNPYFEYDPNDKRHVALAIADGLAGWGYCVLGDIPAGFGDGMVKISRITKCGAEAKDLSAKARELGLLKA